MPKKLTRKEKDKRVAERGKRPINVSKDPRGNRGYSRRGDKFFNPTTGEEETEQQQKERRGRHSTFSIGGEDVTRKEFEAIKGATGFRGGGVIEEGSKAARLRDERLRKLEGLEKEKLTEKFRKQDEARAEADKVIIPTEEERQGLPTGDLELGGAGAEGRLITREELEAGLTQEDIDVGMSIASVGGAMPITAGDVATLVPGGLAKRGAGIGFKSTKDKLLGEVLKGSSQKQIISKQKLIQTWKLTDTQANIFINNFNKMKADEILLKLGAAPKTSVGSKALKTLGVVAGVLGAAGTVAGVDTMITWWALDNILDGNIFLIRDIEDGLTAGTITTREEIDSLFEDADIARDLAIAKIDQSARLNPLLWAPKKFVQAGSQLKSRQYELLKANFYERLR